MGYNSAFKGLKLKMNRCCTFYNIACPRWLNWVDQVNYIVQKAWKALHFVMCVLKTVNRNTKSLAYTSLVCPVLEYGAACWDPCTEGQINALDQVQMKAAQFINHAKDFDWKTMAHFRMIAGLCTLFKAYSGKQASKAVSDRL